MVDAPFSSTVSSRASAGAGSGLARGVYRPPRAGFSNRVASYNGGWGSSADGGRGDSATTDRPFQLVGKNQLNLLDPGARGRQQQQYLSEAGVVPNVHEGFFAPIQDYYDPSNPSGVVGGVVGALGQTIGGIFGQGGAKLGTEIGGALGKTLDIPVNFVMDLPFPTALFGTQVDEFNAAVESNTPYIFSDVEVPKSVSQMLGSLLGLLSVPGRAIGRNVAGQRGLAGIPAHLQARIEAGEITEERAYDLMSVEGGAFSEDPLEDLALSIATDPVNLLTLGVGVVGSAARGSARLATSANKLGKVLNAAEHGATLGRIGELARGTGTVVREADIAALSRGEAYRLRQILTREAMAASEGNPLMNYAVLARSRLVPSAREVLGHVDFETTSNVFYRAAKKTIDITDPLTFLGGRLFGSGALGKRSAEMLATTAQAAVFSGYGHVAISKLARIADQGTPNGSDIFSEALGVHGGNLAQEYAISEHIGDAKRAAKVPILSGANGHSLSPTEAGRAILRGGSYDTNVGKHMELLVQRNIPLLMVRRAGESGDQHIARLLAESRAKMQSMLGPEWNPGALKASDLDEKMAALIHASYYYHVGAAFHNQVVPAMVRAMTSGTLPKSIVDPTRLTLLADRQLTTGRLVAIEAAIASGDVDALRRLLVRYKNFDWLDASAMPGAELIETLERWLATNKGYLPTELDLIDPATGQRYAGLPDELERWLADADAGFGYTLAEAPPANIPVPDLYGAVRNADGMLEGMNPWVDFLANPGAELGGKWAAKAPGRMQAYLSQVTQHVRQERIRWEGQRRFITDMAKGSDQHGLDVPPAVSLKLWKAIMSEAEHQRVQPRGLGVEDMASIVRRSIDEGKRVQDGMVLSVQSLSHHQVMNSMLRATRGDLWTVGGTQWFTGRFKAHMPGAARNFWGQIAEKLFPQVRFEMNPVFQLQELGEPYILNRMRGVKAPLKRDAPEFQEALATHNALMQLARTSLEPDGMMAESAEMLKLYSADYLAARQAFGPDTIWGRVSAKFRPGIGERKAALMALEAKGLFGERFYRTGESIMGKEKWLAKWRVMEEVAQSIDRGDVAMSWAANNLYLADANGMQVTRVMDLQNPHNFGPRLRVTFEPTPGAHTFADIERAIDDVEQYNDGRTAQLYRERTKPRTPVAPVAPTPVAPTPIAPAANQRAAFSAAQTPPPTPIAGKPYRAGEALVAELKSMSEADWMLRAKAFKGIVSDPEALRTIWRMANGPTPKDFWREYRKGYVQRVRGKTAGETRKLRDEELKQHQAFLRIMAESEGITEAEYIARHIHDKDFVQTLQANAILPKGALPDMRPDWMQAALGRRELVVGHMDDIRDDLRYFGDEPQWATARDYYYKRVPMGSMPHRAGQPAMIPSAALRRDWNDLDEIVEEGWNDQTIVRLKKPEAGGDYTWITQRKSGLTLEEEEALRGVPSPMQMDMDPDFDLVEVWDPRASQWRQFGDAAQKYLPVTPAHQLPPQSVAKMYVPPGAPEKVAGLYPVDIEGLLSSAGRNAKVIYKGDGYAVINTTLRGQEYNSGYYVQDVDQVIEDMRGAIQSGANPVELELHRGINLSRGEVEGFDDIDIDYENLEVGEVFRDKGFLSFSTDDTVAYGFAEGGGSSYEVGMVPVHKQVVVHLTAPPGTNMAYIKGMESEHVLGDGTPMRLLNRVTTKTKRKTHRGEVDFISHDIWVELSGHPTLPGVQRLVVEDLTPTQQVNARLARDAVLSPDDLRDRSSLAGHTPEEAAEVEKVIIEAQKHLPPTPTSVADSLADDLAAFGDDADYIIGAYGDVRGRMQDIGGSNTMGMRLVHGLAHALGTEGGMRLGWKELVRHLEDIWEKGAGEADNEALTRALFKGVNTTQGVEPLPAAVDDALDVLLGNRSRRRVGRGEAQEPVLVDQLAMMDAGYPEGTVANEYTHEYVVDFYNRKAAEANRTKYLGRADWSASEVQLLGQHRMQQKLGRTGLAVDVEELDSLTRTLPAHVYPPPTMEAAKFSQLIDIYNEPQNHEQLMGLMDHLGLTLGQELRDTLGFPVLRMDGSGIGMLDDVAQPMVPVALIATGAKADDAADIISYVTGADIWNFTPADVDDLTDVSGLVPRLSITVPDMGGDGPTGNFLRRLVTKMETEGSIRGATARKLTDGYWRVDILDEGGVLPRLEGRVDNDALKAELDDVIYADDMAYPDELDDYELDLDYGTVYKSGPTRVDGVPDWEGHHGETVRRLEERGSRVGGEQLTDIRSTWDWGWRQKLELDAPKQYRRIVNGESPVPHILEDRRGGSLRGYTDIQSDGRAILGAVGEPDPLTGLHELMHVHARTLDPSAKRRVIGSHDTYLTQRRGDLQVRIDKARARATNAKSTQAQKRNLNEANALEAELGGLNNEVDWGAQHEEFLVQEFMKYIHRGLTPNPEMTNVMEHFRVWTKKLQKELFPKGSPALSPEMSLLFDEMFHKRTRDLTVPYSIEDETLRMAAKQQIRDATDEAHGTHYYRKDRRWFERSMNHPYIGVYPSSYMWGKVLPEMLRFLALRPFGYETPMLAWNVLREVSDTMSYQSETNGDVRQFLEDNERAFMLMSMMFPSVPNDISANASLPFRRIAEQSLMNQYKASQGIEFGDETGQVHDINYLSGLEDAVSYAIGPLGAARTAGEVIGIGQRAVEGITGQPEAESGLAEGRVR